MNCKGIGPSAYRYFAQLNTRVRATSVGGVGGAIKYFPYGPFFSSFFSFFFVIENISWKFHLIKHVQATGHCLTNGDIDHRRIYASFGLNLAIFHSMVVQLYPCVFVTIHYNPCFNEVERWYTGFTLSVCPLVRPSVRIVSALHISQY